jgi:hypothetical protein
MCATPPFFRKCAVPLFRFALSYRTRVSMRKVSRLIDPPLSLTDTKPYDDFLARMAKEPQDDPQVQQVIKATKERRAKVEAYLASKAAPGA